MLQHNCRPMLLEDLAAEALYLALKVDLESGSLKGEVESAYAGKKRSDVELLHNRLSVPQVHLPAFRAVIIYSIFAGVSVRS